MKIFQPLSDLEQHHQGIPEQVGLDWFRSNDYFLMPSSRTMSGHIQWTTPIGDIWLDICQSLAEIETWICWDWLHLEAFPFHSVSETPSSLVCPIFRKIGHISKSQPCLRCCSWTYVQVRHNQCKNWYNVLVWLEQAIYIGISDEIVFFFPQMWRNKRSLVRDGVSDTPPGDQYRLENCTGGKIWGFSSDFPRDWVQQHSFFIGMYVSPHF